MKNTFTVVKERTDDRTLSPVLENRVRKIRPSLKAVHVHEVRRMDRWLYDNSVYCKYCVHHNMTFLGMTWYVCPYDEEDDIHCPGRLAGVE